MTLTLLIVGYVLSVIATRKMWQYNFYNLKGSGYGEDVDFWPFFLTFIPGINLFFLIAGLYENELINFNFEWFFKPMK